MNNKHHPIQPLSLDNFGIMRFESNAIVRFLLDNGGYDMNKLAMLNFTREDHEQFAQLIGYSLSGFGELSYVSDETYNTAEKMSEGTDEKDAKIEYLEGVLEKTRQAMKCLVPSLFKIHPDDLRH